MEITRRDFIRKSGVAAGASLVLPEFRFTGDSTQKVKFFMPQWGSSKLSFPEFFEKVKKEGYDGIEMSLPTEAPLRKEAISKIREFELSFIGQIYQPKDPDIKKHIEQAKSYIQILAEAEPLFINSHTGKDFFSFEQNQEIITTITSYAKSLGVKLIHETHRGRFSFASHVTRTFLEKMPEIRMTLDVSHWMCVAESLLENQPEAINLAVRHTDHIHSRVGFSEGPQITDPRAPEWKNDLDAHLAIWDRVVERKRKEGELVTITTEFGPAPYMTSLPYTRQPIASQWEINVFMKDLLTKRYNA
jgi:sugar phosphate isomerase/epimerase